MIQLNYFSISLEAVCGLFLDFLNAKPQPSYAFREQGIQTHHSDRHQ